ncbi:Ig-like domain-containing protein [Bacillus cereus group sp. BY9-3LC]|uniref:Ig-like domain-containing protein n=1 Tax=Bacillus cereus group sp. BY9-3LC TaxID=3018075 RepID=UPI0022E338C9|nr:Ig-like domain-containing protein [Bacillus cereus group sp. BY9-3LC]MDA1777453.1 Ig-like domain-containing protein [Bacillus cereus group sp. BY9-3LC]
MKPLQNKFNPEKIVLGAGTAIFFNWTKGEKEMIDVGATQGDCTFSYTPEFENIKPRGVRGNVKGLVYVTGSETKIKASFLEWLDPETIKHFLLNANVVKYTNDGSDPEKPAGKGAIIRANESLIDCCGTDAYIDDITIIGQTNGCDMYRITLFNALPTSGIEGVFGDAEVAAEVEFTGYNDPQDPMTPPFEIEFFSPDQKCPIEPPEKEKSAKPEVDVPTADDTKITGKGVKGAKISVQVNGGQPKEGVVGEGDKFEVVVDALNENQKVTVTQTEEGKDPSDPVEVTVQGK